MNIDLHCHSNVSDGALPPTEVVRLAKENGAKLLALTDHDNLQGLPEARAEAARLDLPFVNGVEVSITWNSKVIHIVGLNMRDEAPELQAALDTLRSGRITRLQLMSEKLEKKGIAGAYDGALALAGNPDSVGRAHLARYLVQAGHVKNMQQAFKKYLGDGKPAYVKHEWASLEDALAWITAAGGVAVIAHPARYDMSATKMREFITEFKAAGGVGIEVASSSHTLSERLNYAMLAESFELYASAGSDYHALHEGGQLGVPPELPPICKPIWELFH